MLLLQNADDHFMAGERRLQYHLKACSQHSQLRVEYVQIQEMSFGKLPDNVCTLMVHLPVMPWMQLLNA